MIDVTSMVDRKNQIVERPSAEHAVDDALGAEPVR
jgi:hypothetical protein